MRSTHTQTPSPLWPQVRPLSFSFVVHALATKRAQLKYRSFYSHRVESGVGCTVVVGVVPVHGHGQQQKQQQRRRHAGRRRVIRHRLWSLRAVYVGERSFTPGATIFPLYVTDAGRTDTIRTGQLSALDCRPVHSDGALVQSPDAVWSRRRRGGVVDRFPPGTAHEAGAPGGAA